MFTSEDSIDVTSSPSQVQLCVKCQDTLDHLYLRYPESTYEAEHYVLKDLLASAENGCRLCQLFTRSGVTKSDESLKELLHRQEDDRGTLTIAKNGSLMDRYLCYLTLTTYKHENIISHISIRCIRSEVSDEQQFIPFISKTTDSESTWRTARNWIDWCTSTSEEQTSVFCKRTHSPCQNNIVDEKLPTRLVYVSENNKGIRLCLTKEISFDQGKVNYTALTHCWGLKPMPILTNRDNFQQMLCGIPFQLLTKIF